MKPLTTLLIALAAALATAPPAASADQPSKRAFHLQWRDLDRATRGHRIALVLPSRVKLQGDVVAFEDDELVLDVRKTSNKRAYPQGRAIVPRPEITSLRVIRTRRLWRAVGTVVGGGVGTAVAIPVALLAGRSAAPAAALAVAVPAGLGYLFGWAADANVVEIVVDPGPYPLKNAPF